MLKSSFSKLIFFIAIIILIILISLFIVNREIQQQMLFGTKLANPSDCAQNPVAIRWKTCKGRDQSVLQNDLYYIIAAGDANRELCNKFQNINNTQTKVSSCQSTKIENWYKYECNKLNLSNHQCYGCEVSNTSGDTYYHLIAFDNKCEKVIKFSSANLLPDLIEQKLNELNQIENQENNLLSDLKRFLRVFL